jgi:hypothetical protein
MANWRGDQFGHRHFHNNKTLIVPYPYAYDDYEYSTDAVGDYPPTSVVPPPSPPPSPTCHRDVEKFTVPSEGGGSREITIINCP